MLGLSPRRSDRHGSLKGHTRPGAQSLPLRQDGRRRHGTVAPTQACSAGWTATPSHGLAVWAVWAVPEWCVAPVEPRSTARDSATAADPEPGPQPRASLPPPRVGECGLERV